MARIVAGHFDHYICRRDDMLRNRESDEVPMMMREELLAAGVEPRAVEVIPDEQAAVDAALQHAETGDLILIFGDQLARTWGQITGFTSSERVVAAAELDPEVSKPAVLPANVPAFELEMGQTLVRDERGVRLAREEAD